MRFPLKHLKASGPAEAEKLAMEAAKIGNGKHQIDVPQEVYLKMVQIAGLKPEELMDPTVEYITQEWCDRMGMKEAQTFRLLKARQDIRDGNIPPKTRR
jgi:hypothetical protein